MRISKAIGLSALALAAGASLGLAQIQSLTLDQMVSYTSDAVFGEIVDSNVFRAGDEENGIYYYTQLTVQGRSIKDGSNNTVDVLFLGGWINENEGADNSEAPAADDVRVGNKIVAFYNWAEGVGANVSGNFIYAAHGGVYRSVNGPQGTMVLGRGDGYAIAQNKLLGYLEEEVQALYRHKAEEGR